MRLLVLESLGNIVMFINRIIEANSVFELRALKMNVGYILII